MESFIFNSAVAFLISEFKCEILIFDQQVTER